ncbi:MAG: hypothetical protein ABS935_19120, partial [Solibacillus sp.]|uniref:hypothetical protein n=1 Tax=Solibacillus sp. TaxID=1909654 RepID=UPI00331510BD
PNTEVKLFSADGSWGLPPVRVGRRFAQKVAADLVSSGFFILLEIIYTTIQYKESTHNRLNQRWCRK